MLQEKNIAFFIDVDNCGLTSEHYANVIEQLNGMGNILYGKVYGAGERKHKEIYADANNKGYIMERPMRVKRRGRKDFDSRIFVDVIDAVRRAPSIKIVCIIAQPTDLVYLYTYLHHNDVTIVALDNADEASNAFVDVVIDPGMVQEIKLPKSKPAAPKAKPAPAKEPTPAPKAEPAKKPAAKTDVDRTEELLREIERLRALANDEPTPTAAPEVEKPVVEAPKAAPAPKAEPAPAPKVEERPAAKPRTQYTSQNDSDLIRRIDELRRNNEGGDPDDLIDEIRKLLDLE